LKRSTILTILAVAALAAAGLHTGCDKSGKKVLLRFKLKSGMELDYRLTARGPMQEYTDDSLTTDVYVEAQEDFTCTARRVLEDGTIEKLFTGKWQSRRRPRTDSVFADTSLRESPAPEFVRYIKPNGKTIDLELLSDTSQAEETWLKQYHEQTYPVFPDEEVAPGYSWTQSTRVLLPEGPTNVATTYTITGFERVSGYDCAVIGYDGHSLIPLAPQKWEKSELLSGIEDIRFKGHLNFAYREGIEVSAKERWLYEGNRRVFRKASGDTVSEKEIVEYDIDWGLVGVKNP